jgi:hypothetical protein
MVTFSMMRRPIGWRSGRGLCVTGALNAYLES